SLVYAFPPASTSVLLLLTRPLTSTLFPYTTLFRSAAPAWTGGLALIAGYLLWVRLRAGSPARPPAVNLSLLGSPLRSVTLALACDRKSTRLNSSHEWISYAVFCLKKKKEHERLLRN